MLAPGFCHFSSLPSSLPRLVPIVTLLLGPARYFPYVCEPPFSPTRQSPGPVFTPTPWQLCLRVLHLCVGEPEAKRQESEVCLPQLLSTHSFSPHHPALRGSRRSEVPGSLCVPYSVVVLSSEEGVRDEFTVWCKYPHTEQVEVTSLGSLYYAPRTGSDSGDATSHHQSGDSMDISDVSVYEL